MCAHDALFLRSYANALIIIARLRAEVIPRGGTAHLSSALSLLPRVLDTPLLSLPHPPPASIAEVGILSNAPGELSLFYSTVGKNVPLGFDPPICGRRRSDVTEGPKGREVTSKVGNKSCRRSRCGEKEKKKKSDCEKERPRRRETGGRTGRRRAGDSRRDRCITTINHT